MSGGSSRPPEYNPIPAIQEQARVNRVGRVGPFGSATYGTDANGGAVINTTLSPQMEALVNRQFNLASQNSTPYRPPAGFNQLQGAMMNQVTGGMGQNRLQNFQAAQQQGAPPQSVQNHFKPQGTSGLPHPDPSLQQPMNPLPPGY